MAEYEDLDPRLVFYLENKDKIDEWITLPKLESAEATKFFGSLERPLSDRCSALPGSPVLFTESLRGFSFVHLHQQEWLTPEADSPLVSIGLEWRPAKDGFRDAWFGLRVNLRVEGMKPVHAEIEEKLRGVPLLASFRRNNWYPIFQNVNPSREAFWEDTTALAEEIIDSIVDVWSLSWEVAQAALARHGRGSTS